MFRIVPIIAVIFIAFQATVAHAIKVTLAGEIKLGANWSKVTEYNPTAIASGELDFDVVHMLDDGSTLGGNIDLNLSHDLVDSTAPNVNLAKVDSYIEGELGTIWLTTDGVMDKADSFLSVSEEVKGEENDLSLIYELPTVSGFDSSFAFDVINADMSGSAVYKNDFFDTAVDAEITQSNLFVDWNVKSSFQNFTSGFYSALATDFSDTEVEVAVKLSYDFGITEIYAGVSSYAELAGGAEIKVEDLTLNFDVSGIPDGVAAPSYTKLATKEDNSFKLKLQSKYNYTSHLEFSAGLETQTAENERHVSADASVTVKF